MNNTDRPMTSLEEILYGIQYVRLTFNLRLVEDSILPISKASAIRGGIGEMLLRANCIKDRNCEKCNFESECIVRRTMYSKFDIKPEFITSGDSAGYIIECEDYREHFDANDKLQFRLILFGKTIVYFNQYLQAIYALGQNGLGKHHSQFVISSVTNTKGQEIIEDLNVHMSQYQVHTLFDYLQYRRKQLENNDIHRLDFKTPLSLKYQGSFLKSFNIEAITKAIQRRIYILSCFENKNCESFYRESFNIPAITNQSPREISIRRYSNRQDSGMFLTGIKGNLELSEELTGDLLDLFIAGEITHIGKNTSFGFGRYKLS